MGLIGPLIYYLFANATMTFITKKTFGKCLPLTLMLSAFTLFFSQFIFKTFNIGIAINFVFALLSLLLLIKNRKNKEKLIIYKNNYFSKGLYAFLTIYIVVFILDFNRCFSMWDEKSHWGVMIKEMLRIDDFYSAKASTLLVHKDYPPIFQLFELFWYKLSMSYKESYIIRAVHVFEFSLFIPAMVEKIKINTDKKAIIRIISNTVAIMGIIFLMILFFDQHNIINSIYNDYMMAILVAYGICVVVFEKNTLSNFTLLTLSTISSFLLLTKQMGLPLYLIILFIFIVDLIIKYINNKKTKKLLTKENILIALKVFIILIIVPLLLWKFWNNYIDSLHIEKQFDLADLKIMKLPSIMKGTYGEKWQNTAAINYISAVKSRNITTSNVIVLTYVQSLILFLVLLYIIWLIGKKYFYKKQIPLIGSTILIGAIGYAIVMLIMYVFSFGSREGVNISSFDRYMDTYMIIALSVIIMLYVWIINQKEKNNSYVWIICSVLFLIQSPKMTTAVYPKLTAPYKDEYAQCADIIKQNVENKAKVFLIAQDSPGDYQFYVKYYANPIITNLDYFHLPVDDKTNYKDYYDNGMREYMMDYDYVFIANITDEAIKKYSFIFPNKDVKKYQLYKIIKTKNNFKLELIK